VILTPFAVGFSIPARRAWRELRAGRRPSLPRTYHRRYVVPAVDLDQEARQMWSRAARAADAITRSAVVEDQSVDSVRLSAVVPEWLWDIAEKLALLSEIRAGQREILSALDAGTTEVSAALDRQRRARDQAAAAIERKVRHLETLAGRVAEADSALRRVGAVREMQALNDSHADLLARIDQSAPADAHEAELLSRDLQVVIAHADEAIRQANEAASILALPGE
jgi:hypothetical protein